MNDVVCAQCGGTRLVAIRLDNGRTDYGHCGICVTKNDICHDCNGAGGGELVDGTFWPCKTCKSTGLNNFANKADAIFLAKQRMGLLREIEIL